MVINTEIINLIPCHILVVNGMFCGELSKGKKKMNELFMPALIINRHIANKRKIDESHAYKGFAANIFSIFLGTMYKKIFNELFANLGSLI